ncbi:MAG: hypothetical protein ACKO83_13000, partial [Roseiflexaceae bacterium]
LTHDGARGEMVRAAGGMEIGVAGFFHAGGTMAIEKSSGSFTLADSSKVMTEVLTIGGADLNGFIGINGPYRSDTNGDGRTDLADEINPEAVGLSASGIEFGLGLFKEQATTNARDWMSLQAKAAEVAMVGVPGITASATDIAVSINQVINARANTAERLQVIDFSDSAFDIYTGYDTTIALEMDGAKGELISASGTFDVSVAGFVEAHGSMAFEKFQTTVKLADGNTVVVDALTLGGVQLSAFAGVGGPYFIDTDGDGDIDGDDERNVSSVGFVMDDAEFAMALLATPEGATRLGGASWLGVEASAAKVGFVGGADLEMSVSNVEVQINQVFGLPIGSNASSLVA